MRDPLPSPASGSLSFTATQILIRSPTELSDGAGECGAAKRLSASAECRERAGFAFAGRKAHRAGNRRPDPWIMSVKAMALDEVALTTARRMLGAATVTRAEISEMTGSDGDAILKVRLVVVPEVVRGLGGRQILDTLSAMRRAVEATGEERRISVEYADQNELDEVGAD